MPLAMALRAAMCCVACWWCACNHAKQRNFVIGIIVENHLEMHARSGDLECSPMVDKMAVLNDTQYVSETSYNDQYKEPKITWLEERWIQNKNYDLVLITGKDRGSPSKKGRQLCRQCDWDPATSRTYDHHCLYAVICAHRDGVQPSLGDIRRLRRQMVQWWLQEPVWLKQTAEQEGMTPRAYLLACAGEGWGGLPELQLYSYKTGDYQYKVITNTGALLLGWMGPTRNYLIFEKEHYSMASTSSWSCSSWCAWIRTQYTDSLNGFSSARGGMHRRRRHDQDRDYRRPPLRLLPARRPRSRSSSWDVLSEQELPDRPGHRERPRGRSPQRRRQHERPERREEDEVRRDHPREEQQPPHEHVRVPAHEEAPARRPVLEAMIAGQVYCMVCRRWLDRPHAQSVRHRNNLAWFDRMPEEDQYEYLDNIAAEVRRMHQAEDPPQLQPEQPLLGSTRPPHSPGWLGSVLHLMFKMV